ncbi:MAG: DUF3465 domain-containing protein [Coriobacteriia bacterium]|nr:DUF3465 domain-containing protein [Coriobacteriia bacterium]
MVIGVSRLILELASGKTLLMAHNIDIAPRIESLAAVDLVAFAGVGSHPDD